MYISKIKDNKCDTQFEDLNAREKNMHLQCCGQWYMCK